MSLSANRFYYTNTNYNDASNVLINYDNLTGNNDLIKHPLNKYARELFFSPSYNSVFFNSINWANSLGKYKNQNNLINPLVDNVLMNIDILDDAILAQSLINHIVQMGSPINGEIASDSLGWAISSNEDGTIVAIGSYHHAPGGVVRVYEWNGSIWNQMGIDIDAESSGDLFGMSVSLSANGKIFASGGYSNAGSGTSAGHARVYEWNGSTWVQMGSDIDAEAAGDRSGITISLSANGKIVAVGARENDGTTNNTSDNRGHVRVYEYNNDTNVWDIMGNDIDGEASGDQSAGSYYSNNVSLNANGTIVAIGAIHNDGGAQDSGHVRVYDYDETRNPQWKQLGDDIDGEVYQDWFGNSVSLSADGTIVAIGAPRHDTTGDRAGRVYVYKYNLNIWEIIGTFDGEYANDQYGMCVSLNNDGTILAIGGPQNLNKGHVRIYQYIKGLYSSEWIKIGNDIEGEGTSDQFGHAVSLSKDGSVLVVSAVYDDNTGTNTGSVYTYELFKEPSTSILNMGSPINGPHVDSYFGMSTSCNDDCSIIAIGGPGKGDNTFFDYNTPRTYINSGGARVYQYINNTWQYMFAVSGRYNEEQCGCSVALNADGTIFAVGASHDTGCVRVYDYVQGRSPEWQQMGSNIIGSSGHGSGWSISLSDDGTVLAVGGIFASNFIGRATMYKWNGTSWQNKGTISGTSNSWAGWSVSLSGNGNKVAVGALNSNGGTGHVMVYEWNGSWWASTATINGEMGGGLAGHSVSFSNDGNTLAIGAPKNSTGTVCVYKWNNSSWQKIGNTIYADSGTSRGGYSCSLNADGTILAFGASGGTGRVYIYQYVNGLYASGWVKVGYIDGQGSGDRYGAAVSLSKSGSKLVTGGLYNDVTGTNSGRAYIYELFKQPTFKSIIKMGSPIDGEAANDNFGYCVSCNADGTVIAASAPFNDDSDIDSGHVCIYKYFNPNDAVDNYNDHTYFGVIPTSKSTNKNWAFYSFKIKQSGIDIIYFNGSNYNNLIWNSSTRPSGPHGWGWQYGPSLIWTNTATPLWYVKTDATIDGTPLTFELINYDQNHSPLSGNFVSSSSPNGPWVVRNSWISNPPLTSVSATPSAGYVITSDLNKNWIQMGNTIYGESVNDYSGYSISLNADGTIIAIGAQMQYSNASFGPVAGHVRIFKYNTTTNIWDQSGNDIDGESARDYFGTSVSLNGDGTIVAIGAYMHNSTTGHVRIYEWDGSTWNKMGDDIDGKGANRDRCGYSVSFSADEKIVAIGSPYNNDGGNAAGHTRIYKYINDTWTQLGLDIVGEVANDQSGYSVSLNADGTIVAIGALYNDGTGTSSIPNSGHVRIYNYDENREPKWKQIGSDIDGEAPNDHSSGGGQSVSLSADGTIVAIGAHDNDGNGTNSGHVRVFKYDNINNNWVQIGYDIDGEASVYQSGWSVSLSKNGLVLVVGELYNGANGGSSGRVFTYEIVDINNTVEENN